MMHNTKNTTLTHNLNGNTLKPQKKSPKTFFSYLFTALVSFLGGASIAFSINLNNVNTTNDKSFNIKNFGETNIYYEELQQENKVLKTQTEKLRLAEIAFDQQDYNKAIEYYVSDDLSENGIAQNNLGYMYEQGLGVKLDTRQALRYYIESIEEAGSGNYIKFVVENHEFDSVNVCYILMDIAFLKKFDSIMEYVYAIGNDAEAMSIEECYQYYDSIKQSLPESLPFEKFTTKYKQLLLTGFIRSFDYK